MVYICMGLAVHCIYVDGIGCTYISISWVMRHNGQWDIDIYIWWVLKYRHIYTYSMISWVYICRIYHECIYVEWYIMRMRCNANEIEWWCSSLYLIHYIYIYIYVYICLYFSTHHMYMSISHCPLCLMTHDIDIYVQPIPSTYIQCTANPIHIYTIYILLYIMSVYMSWYTNHSHDIPIIFYRMSL